MQLIQLATLALLQAVKEFLPVSSSAKVILTEKLMGLDPTSPEMTLFVVMGLCYAIAGVGIGGLIAFRVLCPSLSFVAGLLALRWFSSWLEQGRWHLFGIYCLMASLAALAIGRTIPPRRAAKPSSATASQRDDARLRILNRR